MTNTEPHPRKGRGVKEREPDILKAVQENNEVEVRAALARDGSCINVQDDQLMTPLHWACAYRNAAMVELLLEEQHRPPVDPFIVDSRGRLPIDIARTMGSKGILGRFDQWFNRNVVRIYEPEP